MVMVPCFTCTSDGGLKDERAFIEDHSFAPAEDDPDFVKLVGTLIATLSQLVQSKQIATPADPGQALAALFDLCVSLEYAKLVTDTNWVLLPC